jgi:hypothetical protein
LSCGLLRNFLGVFEIQTLDLRFGHLGRRIEDVEIVYLEFYLFQLETLPLDFARLLVQVHRLGSTLVVVVTAILLVVNQDVVLLVVRDNLRVRSVLLGVMGYNG